MRGMNKAWLGLVLCVGLASGASADRGDPRLISTIRVSYKNLLPGGQVFTLQTKSKSGQEKERKIKRSTRSVYIEDWLTKTRPHFITLPNGARIKLYTMAEACRTNEYSTAIKLRASLEKLPDNPDDLITSDPKAWSRSTCVGGAGNLKRRVTVEVGQGGITFSTFAS